MSTIYNAPSRAHGMTRREATVTRQIRELERFERYPADSKRTAPAKRRAIELRQARALKTSTR